jgi:hypothetical protein
VKFARIFRRIGLLSLVAAAFVGLTKMYGGSARPPLPSPHTQAERQHRLSAPQVSQFPEFVGEASVLALYAVAGRRLFRLRLSRAPRGEEQPVLLNLHQERDSNVYRNRLRVEDARDFVRSILLRVTSREGKI